MKVRRRVIIFTALFSYKCTSFFFFFFFFSLPCSDKITLQNLLQDPQKKKESAFIGEEGMKIIFQKEILHFCHRKDLGLEGPV